MNPSIFLMHHEDVPFNFDMNSNDYDIFYHDTSMPKELKGGDPCTWSLEKRNACDQQCDAWISLYNACSRGEHEH